MTRLASPKPTIHLHKVASCCAKTNNRFEQGLVESTTNSKQDNPAWKAVLWVTGGNAPGQHGILSVSAWKAVRPRRWRCEPHEHESFRVLKQTWTRHVMKAFMRIDAERNWGNNWGNNGGNNGEKKCRVSHAHRLHYYIYVNKRGKQKTIQTIHKTLHKPYISLIFRMLQNV